MKEYDIETTNLVDSYYSPGLIWYRKHLVSKMDQVLAMEKKPGKDWKEQFSEVQDKFVDKLSRKFDKVDAFQWEDAIQDKQD